MIADAAEQTPVNEAELLAAAESEPTDVFGHTLRDHVNEQTAGEELQQRRRRQRAQRRLSLKHQSDGMVELFGRFDPVAGARIETALAAAAKKLWHNEDPKNRATPAQRYADALEALVTRNGSGKAQSTTLLLIADYDSVAGQLTSARLADGTPLSANELVKLALEAKILPALFDTAGQPLWLGREQRDANTAQRIALAARDRGCIGCGAPNSFCQPHHIQHWENGGTTVKAHKCPLTCLNAERSESQYDLCHASRQVRKIAPPDGAHRSRLSRRRNSAVPLRVSGSPQAQVRRQPQTTRPAPRPTISRWRDRRRSRSGGPPAHHRNDADGSGSLIGRQTRGGERLRDVDASGHHLGERRRPALHVERVRVE